MTKTRGTGLLMVWNDIDGEYEAEFNRGTTRSTFRDCSRCPVFSTPAAIRR